MSSKDSDPARLVPLVAEALRDFVDTWNVFIVGDSKGRELDEIRLGPQDADAARQVNAAAASIVEAIEHSENVATTYAVEAITEQAQCAKNAAQGVDGDQANDLSRKTTGNFVIQTLRSAYALLRTETGFALREYRAGVYRTAEAATAGGVGFVAYSNWPAILSFVAKNADALREFARHNPTVVEIINAIARRCLNVAPL